MKLKFNKGFTLIELMVVVVIIAILTSIVVSSFSQAKAKSRDAKRISDLAQIQLALELAFDKCNVYPPVSTVSLYKVLTIGTAINGPNCPNPSNGNAPYLMSDFITSIPFDPLDSPANAPAPQYKYRYEVSANKLDYRLMATLETMTGLAAGGVTGNIGSINCNGYQTTNFYCVSPR